MSSYQNFFSGSLVDVDRIVFDLSEINIPCIVKDESRSANLAGFGISNFLYNTHTILIEKKFFEKAIKHINLD